jgi:hypothetical protein
MGLAALHSYLARDFDPAKTHAGQCVDVDPATNTRDFPVENTRTLRSSMGPEMRF